MQTVFFGEELPTFLEDGVAGYGLIFLGAEDEADGGVVAFDFEEVFVEADIAVHLADVLMGELADFQINEDEAFQEVVVEDEVHIEFVILEDDALLPGDEGEAASRFPQCEGHPHRATGRRAQARAIGPARRRATARSAPF